MGEWLCRSRPRARLGEPWGPWREWLQPGVPTAWNLSTALRTQAAEGFTHPAPLQAWDSRDRRSDGRGSIAEALNSLAQLWEAQSQPSGDGLDKPGAHHLCGRCSIVRSTCFGAPLRVPPPVNKHQPYLTAKLLLRTAGQENAAEKP